MQSVDERQLYLTRYMQNANDEKRRKRSPHGSAPGVSATVASPVDTPTACSVASITAQPPPPPTVSAYPAYSTHAVAESLLAESITRPAVPLSSLPAITFSHCSPPERLLASLPASSAAVQRLRSLYSEPATALLTRTFADLHARGSVVTAGQLYGGDLLLYADDPSSCHAHSIVSVQSAAESPDAEPAISALELLTVARIASGVSKGVVLAYEAADDAAQAAEATDAGGMAYLSLHWQPTLSAAP